MTTDLNLFIIGIFCFLLVGFQSNAQSIEQDSIPNIYYGDKGWHIESADKLFSTDLELRLQFRYAYPFDQDPYTLEDLNLDAQHIFRISRARVKIGGHAFSPKFKYYMEYEISNGNLLDFWGMYSFNPAIQVMVGQYKARYNSERVISSGKQQTVDRSILNRAFTLDRQTGITLLGNLKGNGALNFSYWAAVFSGTGQGDFVADDSKPMWKIRGQWNMFGNVLKFVGSDIDQKSEWRGYIAGGWSNNHSQFTRYSQAGGGQLEGYPEQGGPGQYAITQYFVETAFKKSGFSWQQEYHRKEIVDQINHSTRTLYGNYMQLGTFPTGYISGFPSKLEFAFRYSFYVPDAEFTDIAESEYSVGTNWFFNGHRNKLTAEASYLDVQDYLGNNPGWRYRIQWDISF